MSRQEKIGATVLGLLLFSGLFYFIYTTMKSPLSSDLADEEFFGETFEEEDLVEEAAESPEPGEEPEEALTPPAPAAEKPAAPPKKK